MHYVHEAKVHADAVGYTQGSTHVFCLIVAPSPQIPKDSAEIFILPQAYILQHTKVKSPPSCTK